MKTSHLFSVIDSHTAGHPTRTVTSGIPILRGNTVRELRDDFRNKHDRLRGLLLHEPRGHAATVAAVPVPSQTADQGLFFISSYVYLDMCGHATIGYIASMAAIGALPEEFREKGMSIETPAGTVHVEGSFEGDQLTRVILRNVACHLAETDIRIEVEGVGTVACDIGYSGITYALVEANQFDMPLDMANVNLWCRTGAAIKEALNKTKAYTEVGSVLFHEPIAGGARHLVVLSGNKFDRSPCGTGTSSRLAQLHARGELEVGQKYRAESILGVPFEAQVLELTQTDNGEPAVVPEIRGMAHITAFSNIVLEVEDPLSAGFLPG